MSLCYAGVDFLGCTPTSCLSGFSGLPQGPSAFTVLSLPKAHTVDVGLTGPSPGRGAFPVAVRSLCHLTGLVPELLWMESAH